MIRCLRLEVRKDEHTTLPIAVPEWEVPILDAVHGPDNVKRCGTKLIDRDPPEAQDEFVRLVNRYGRSEDENGTKGPPWAHIVYGQLGVQRVAEAIKAAVEEAPQGDLVGSDE